MFQKIKGFILQILKEFQESGNKSRYLFGLFIRYELFMLKWSLLIPVKLLYWLMSTYPGLAFTTFLTLFFSAIPYPMNYGIYLVFCEVMSTNFLCLMLSQFEISRKYLILLIGEQNYNKYIGENPGSTLGKRLLYTGGFVMGIGLGKIGLDMVQTNANARDASLYAEKCRKEGVQIDPERFHAHFDRRPHDYFTDILRNIPKK